jgi:hypothetical protein
VRYKVDHLADGPFVFTREDGQVESFDDPEVAGLHCKKLRELGHEVDSDSIRAQNRALFEELVRLLDEMADEEQPLGGIARETMTKLDIKKKERPN